MKGIQYLVCIVCLMAFQLVQSQGFSSVLLSATENENCVTSDPLTSNAIRYYYFPNLSAYFDVKSSQYIFKENGEWVRKDRIAPNYRGYCVYNNFKVEITDYFGETPYVNLQQNQKMFPADYKGTSINKMIHQQNTGQNEITMHLNH